MRVFQDLSRRENEVANGILEMLTNKEIGSRLGIEERSVKFHVCNILAKYDLRFRGQTNGRVRLTMKLAKMAGILAACLVLWMTPAKAQSHTVVLTWTASTSTVTGYNVYRGTTKGGPYSKLTTAPLDALKYTDALVTAGNTYYYVGTAVNSTGESIYSNEVPAPVPQGTTTPPVTIIPPANPATFTPPAGTKVGQVAANVVRAAASTSGASYGTAPKGATGTITMQPAINSNQGWIYVQVQYDTCPWATAPMQSNKCIGWTGSDLLGTVQGAPPPPPPKPTITINGNLLTIVPTNVPIGSPFTGTITIDGVAVQVSGTTH